MGPRNAGPGAGRHQCGNHTPSFCPSAAPRPVRRHHGVGAQAVRETGESSGWPASCARRATSRAWVSTTVPRPTLTQEPCGPSAASTCALREPGHRSSDALLHHHNEPGTRLILPQEASPRGAAELSVFAQVRARGLCGTNDVKLSEGYFAHGSHHGGHRCQRHARPARRQPPGQPIYSGGSSSRVTRVDASDAGRGLAGAHGTSPAHARVCHRAHRPRLPTTCREALRERRTPTWRLQDRSRVW
jgi:hypothetical protein